MPEQAIQMDFERRLWSHAQTEVTRLGRAFAPQCEQLVRGLVTGAAGALRAQPERLTDAEANLTRLIDEMGMEASLRGDADLHEASFVGAMSHLCPLWPFC